MATDSIPQKRCTRCNIEFPATLDYFQSDRQKRTGLSSQCKSCKSQQKKVSYQADPEKTRVRVRDYYKANTEVIKEKSKEYRLAHPEEYRAYRHKWATANPEKDKQAKREWEQRNPDKVLEKGRKHRLQKPEIYLNNKHRRRAKHAIIPYDMTEQDWMFMFEYWHNECCICGRVAGDGFILARDHWIAVRNTRHDNPGTVITNMLPMCHSSQGASGGCNNSKSHLDPITWVNSRYAPDEASTIIGRITQYFEIAKARKHQ